MGIKHIHIISLLVVLAKQPVSELLTCYAPSPYTHSPAHVMTLRI